MGSFRSAAIDSAGKSISGVMEAADLDAVISRLQRDGCTPMSAEAADAGRFGWFPQLEFGRGGLRRRDVAAFTRELSVMLPAGQDLDRTLRFMAEIAPTARVRGVVEQLRAAIRDGAQLANRPSRRRESTRRTPVCRSSASSRC